MDWKEEAEKEDEPLFEMVDSAVRKLSEHFDSVLILVNASRGEKCRTLDYTKGAGNYCAQLGQVQNWLWNAEAYYKRIPEE